MKPHKAMGEGREALEALEPDALAHVSHAWRFGEIAHLAVASDPAPDVEAMLAEERARRKWCPKCRAWRDRAAAFSSDRTRPDGLHRWCRACDSADRRARRRRAREPGASPSLNLVRARQRLADRRYRERHADRVRERDRAKKRELRATPAGKVKKCRGDYLAQLRHIQGLSRERRAHLKALIAACDRELARMGVGLKAGEGSDANATINAREARPCDGGG